MIANTNKQKYQQAKQHMLGGDGRAERKQWKREKQTCAKERMEDMV
jgi:uncharacterized protein